MTVSTITCPKCQTEIQADRVAGGAVSSPRLDSSSSSRLSEKDDGDRADASNPACARRSGESLEARPCRWISAIADQVAAQLKVERVPASSAEEARKAQQANAAEFDGQGPGTHRASGSAEGIRNEKKLALAQQAQARPHQESNENSMMPEAGDWT